MIALPFSEISFKIEAILKLFEVKSKEAVEIDFKEKLKLFTGFRPNPTFRRLLEIGAPKL